MSRTSPAGGLERLGPRGTALGGSLERCETDDVGLARSPVGGVTPVVEGVGPPLLGRGYDPNPDAWAEGRPAGTSPWKMPAVVTAAIGTTPRTAITASAPRVLRCERTRRPTYLAIASEANSWGLQIRFRSGWLSSKGGPRRLLGREPRPRGDHRGTRQEEFATKDGEITWLDVAYVIWRARGHEGEGAIALLDPEEERRVALVRLD